MIGKVNTSGGGKLDIKNGHIEEWPAYDTAVDKNMFIATKSDTGVNFSTTKSFEQYYCYAILARFVGKNKFVAIYNNGYNQTFNITAFLIDENDHDNMTTRTLTLVSGEAGAMWDGKPYAIHKVDDNTLLIAMGQPTGDSTGDVSRTLRYIWVDISNFPTMTKIGDTGRIGPTAYSNCKPVYLESPRNNELGLLFPGVYYPVHYNKHNKTVSVDTSEMLSSNACWVSNTVFVIADGSGADVCKFNTETGMFELFTTLYNVSNIDNNHMAELYSYYIIGDGLYDKAFNRVGNCSLEISANPPHYCSDVSNTFIIYSSQRTSSYSDEPYYLHYSQYSIVNNTIVTEVSNKIATNYTGDNIPIGGSYYTDREYSWSSFATATYNKYHKSIIYWYTNGSMNHNIGYYTVKNDNKYGIVEASGNAVGVTLEKCTSTTPGKVCMVN